MMESLGKYLTSVAAAAIISSVISKLYPKGRAASSIIQMMCGVFMMVTVVSPWLKLPVYDFTSYAQSFVQQADAAIDWGNAAAEEYKRTLITEKVSTYILDKAAQLDMEIEVEVILSADEQSIPCGIMIKGEVPEEKKYQMQNILEEELGIGRADQIWTGPE